MSNLVGSGKELYISELPTARDMLRYGALINFLPPPPLFFLMIDYDREFYAD